MSLPLSKIRCTKCDFSHTDHPRGIILKYMLGTHEFLTEYRITGWCYKCNGIQDIEKLSNIHECQSELEELQSKIKGLEKEIAVLKAGLWGGALKKSKINELEDELTDAKQEFAEAEKKLIWISKRKSGARCLHCGAEQTKALAFKSGTDGRHIAQGFTHSCGGQLFIVDVEDGPRFAVSPITIVLDMEGNILPADKPKPKIQNVPKSLQTDGIDEKILEFQEEYPDLYNFVLKVLDGNCDDAALQAFKDDYGEEILNDILKIISGKASEKDIEAFLDEYSEEIYNPILKMIQNKKPRRKDLPKAVHGQEKFKKGDFIGPEYEVFGVLGEGGCGIVYLVYSKWDKAVYALKTVKEEYIEDINIRKRFIKETHAWINLDRNPFIVQAYFISEISGRLFLKLEYVSPDKTGLNTLDGYLRRRPPDLQQSILWGLQFCYGMEHVYSRGIRAHRDIKPSNIMIISDGTLKITDFGLAGVISTPRSFSGVKIKPQRIISGETYQTMAGTAFGTPPYMAPEQFINSAGCNEQSDIYSFGIVLYQMATGGMLPFCPDVQRNALFEEIFNAWYQQHWRISIPKIDSPLYPYIKKCCEKIPGERYQSFKQLRANLELLLKRYARKSFICPQNKELDAKDWNNKGNSLEIIGKYEEALDCFNKALDINPLYADAWEAKGFILGERLSRPQDAMTCYEKASAIKPDSANSWNCMGMGYSGLGEHQEAIKCYDRALELDPHYVVALFNKGIEYMHLYEWKDEIACYDKAIEIDPLFGWAWGRKGARLSLFHKYAEAIECYDQALKIDPKDIYAWRMKGSTLEKLNKYNEAAYCYTQALAINPLSDEIWYGKEVGEIIKKMKRTE